MPEQNKSSLEFYKTFPRKSELTKAEYRFITEFFNTALLYNMINTGNNFLLPFSLGILGILQKKGTQRNYQFFKDTGQHVNERNWHSDGRIAVFRWRKAGGAYFGEPTLKSSYTFRPARFVKRYFAKRLKSDLTINLYYNADY